MVDNAFKPDAGVETAVVENGLVALRSYNNSGSGATTDPFASCPNLIGVPFGLTFFEAASHFALDQDMGELGALIVAENKAEISLTSCNLALWVLSDFDGAVWRDIEAVGQVA
jgi:hypothetical protein